MSSAAALRAQDPDAWERATTSPFLTGARDGTLAPSAFDRWLEQDHQFVEALVRAWGVLVTAAPRQDLLLLTAGMQAFAKELAWFEGIAGQRGLHLDVAALPATTTYTTHLLEMAARPYPEAITAMWAVEATYLTAWRGALGGAETFTEYITHWANDEFSAFVDDLAAIVDRELPAGPDDAAIAAVNRVLADEADFWRMTLQSDKEEDGHVA